MSDDMLAAALDYALAGLPVLPLHTLAAGQCTCGSPDCASPAKHPRLTNGLNGASTDVAVVAGWWQRWPDANVGIATGAKSRLVVLDVDAGHGGAGTLAGLERVHGKLPKTAKVLTGGGGAHYFFHQGNGEVRNSAGKLGAGLDVRADGGYVVAPPSIHASGRVYRWTSDLAKSPPADMPPWLLEDARTQRSSGAAPVGDEIPQGARDSTLASLAGTMRRRGMSEAELLAALRVTNETRCKPPLADTDVQRIAQSIAKKPPAAEVPAQAENATDNAVLSPEPFRLVPVEWEPILAHGVPEIEYVSAPYLPARKRIWGVGAAEAGKSIWAAFKASELTRAGLTVVVVSQENGLEEETRRFMRLGPDFGNLRLCVDQGLDLALPAHVAALIEVSQGAALTVIDTLSACWSGDEDSNTAVVAFDRDVLLPLIRETGASPLVLDHTGNPQPFVRRRGVSAPRGASAKGQKADFLLEFRAGNPHEFTIDHGKARGAKGKESSRTFRVIDTDDDGLDVIEVEGSDDLKVAALADSLVDYIRESGEIGTNKLREAAKALKAGTNLQTDALALLEAEDPPRVTAAWGMIETETGRQRAKVWRPSGVGS